MNTTTDLDSPDTLMPAKIVYGLYAAGYFFGVTFLAGVIFAYIKRGGDPVLDSHLTFQIRTFWISLGLFLIAMVLVVALGLGVLVALFLLVWGLTRIISGFLIALEKRPITGTRYLGILAV